MTTLQTLAVYALAAVAEIAGCFAIWSWWRLEASAFWLIPGLVALAVFGGLLAQSSVGFAGRAYAAYGGVYVAASLVWLWVVEGQRPDRWDLIGAGVILSGTALILLAHREG